MARTAEIVGYSRQMATEQCEPCRGKGRVMVSEWNDQYDRTHASYDTCPGCGGEGEIQIASDEGCPEAIAQWASFGEREDNWFSRNFNTDKGIAERSSDPMRGRRE